MRTCVKHFSLFENKWKEEDTLAKYLKTPLEKFQTKVDKMISHDGNLELKNGKVKIRRKTLFDYDMHSVSYKRFRYYPSRKDDLIEDEWTARIILNHATLGIFSSNVANPPKTAKSVVTLFGKALNRKFCQVIIGDETNWISGDSIHITKELYDLIGSIENEESKDKIAKIYSRVFPLIKNYYQVDVDETLCTVERDFSILIDEIINSGEYTQTDILAMTDKLEKGEPSNIVINRQISKQVEWLIDTIQSIIDEPNITKAKAKELGQYHFGFSKSRISGPECLMEKILTEYGKYTLFGVPELLNTDKYVISENGLPRCQFDIILFNYLYDVEVVELKRPDKFILDYDQERNKFFPSKDLSIAIGQAERYISTFHNSSNNEYQINNQTIKEYVQQQLGGSIEINVCRPSALIIMGTQHNLSIKYEEINVMKQATITKAAFDYNCHQAYIELKNAFKSINIMTYSELIENARLRIK